MALLHAVLAFLALFTVSAFAASSSYVGLGLNSANYLNVYKITPTGPGIIKVKPYAGLAFGYPSTVTGGFSVSDNLRSRYIGFILSKTGIQKNGGWLYSVDLVNNKTNSTFSPVFFASMDINSKGDTLYGVGIDSTGFISFYQVPMAGMKSKRLGGAFFSSEIAVPGQGVRMGVLAPGDATWYQVTPAFQSTGQKVLVVNPANGAVSATLKVSPSTVSIVSIHKDSKKSRFLAIGVGSNSTSWFLGTVKFAAGTATVTVLYTIPVDMGLLYTSFNMVTGVMIIEAKTALNGYTIMQLQVDTGFLTSLYADNNNPANPKMPVLGSVVEVRV